MRSLVMVTGFCAIAGLTSPALADRGLSRTLEEGLERQPYSLETTRFDESFDVLDYRSNLSWGAKPEEASIHSLDLSIPLKSAGSSAIATAIRAVKRPERPSQPR